MSPLMTSRERGLLGSNNPLRLPLIAAPMTGVSSLTLVAAAAAAGIAGSFPVHNPGSIDELDRWLVQLGEERTSSWGPVVPNLIVHRTNDRLSEELSVVIRHAVPSVITSVGSPHEILEPLHESGILVYSDVASLRHAQRAIDAGVDGLVLLSAGAGGQTGWANPFVFIRAVRAIWDGPIVLAGGITDGVSLCAALVAGADLAYMGTGFIATNESAASPSYKEAVVSSQMDDIERTSALTGLETSMIKQTHAPVSDQPPRSDRPYDATILRDRAVVQDRFSAGHSVSGVHAVLDVAHVIARLQREYDAAISLTRHRQW
jgi:nitronate monooxygenase